MTKSTGVGRGGKRAGAGRTAADGATGLSVRISAWVSEDDARWLLQLGDGAIGVGIRKAIALARAPAKPGLQSVAKPRGPIRRMASQYQKDGKTLRSPIAVQIEQAGYDVEFLRAGGLL